MQREMQHPLSCHLIVNHLLEHTANFIVGYLVQVEFLQLAGVKLLPGFRPVYKQSKEISWWRLDSQKFYYFFLDKWHF